jgi:hypothetical protein
MNEILENLPTYVGSALGAYTVLLFGAQAIQDLTTKKIRSQTHLDKIIEEESSKLGMDPRLIIGTFYTTDNKDYNKIYGARGCEYDYKFEGKIVPFKCVDIKEGWGARRGAVKHELYHLKKHVPVSKNPIVRTLKGFFYEEPTATLYATTGIQL